MFRTQIRGCTLYSRNVPLICCVQRWLFCAQLLRPVCHLALTVIPALAIGARDHSARDLAPSCHAGGAQ